MVAFIGDSDPHSSTKFRQPMIDAFNKLGQDLAGGIAAGLRAGTATVTGAITDIVNAALAAAKLAAGIASPAKKFIPIGLFGGQGIGVGFERARSYVENAVSRLVNFAANVANDSFGSLQLPVFGFNPVQALAGAGFGGSVSGANDNRQFFTGVIHQHFGTNTSRAADEEWADSFTR